MSTKYESDADMSDSDSGSELSFLQMVTMMTTKRRRR